MKTTTKRTPKRKVAISEDTIRRKAEEIYLKTGNSNANDNWFAARKMLGLD
jgi:hypothetical protein